MDQSLTLLSAQVHFLDIRLSLIHIPLPLYNTFVAPLLQLLAPAQAGAQLPKDDEDDDDHVRARRPWAFEHPFVNVSVTPVECSVVCSTALVKHLFLPIRNALEPKYRDQVTISLDEFICIQVDGEGLDAGQRVLELSGPLAMNGISIFFITTYFSDYILVPLKSRSTVTSALESRGFAFHADAEAFVNIASPLMSTHRGSTSSADSNSGACSYFASSPVSATRPPSTPPPSSIAELQARTFSLLAKRGINPVVDSSIQLVQCAGRKDTLRNGIGTHASAEISQLRLQMGLLKCLYTNPRPRFFSVTLTDTEPASLILERSLLANFCDSSVDDDDVLIGNKTDTLVPITLDLRTLPMESTGIVCGVAGALMGGTSGGGGGGGSSSSGAHAEFESDEASNVGSEGEFHGSGSIEMTYLSTAMAGTVMVEEVELDRALHALKTSGGARRRRASGDEEATKGVEALQIKRTSVARDW